MTDAVTSLPVPLDPMPATSEDRRLWIGNLDTRVTDYRILLTFVFFFYYWFVLLKLLQKYGPIEKFDLLFHRSGPLEGQPRGYAFVTYSTVGSAKLAKENLDGKLVKSKELSVKWAQNIEKDNLFSKQKPLPDIPALAGARSITKLSKKSTIQAIEAKLKKMEAAKSLEFEINKTPITSATSITSLNNKFKNKKTEKHKSKPYTKRF